MKWILPEAQAIRIALRHHHSLRVDLPDALKAASRITKVKYRPDQRQQAITDLTIAIELAKKELEP
jgi:hypothetical protein